MLVSVITINYNNKDGLIRTIKSVSEQTRPDVEFIVIDGGSTDGSLNIIMENVQHIASWISEKDNGPYDAMNKGINFSTGEYLIFLNSGDYFYSDKSLEWFASQQEKFDIIYGDLEVIEPNNRWVKHYPKKLSFKYFLTGTLPHPSSFIKRSVFDNVGLYEANMLISADWAFFVKAICLHQMSYKYIPHVISSFSYDGISSSTGNRDLILAEKKQYLENNFPLFIDDYKEINEISNKYNNLKNSRLRKYLSYIFKQLEI